MFIVICLFVLDDSLTSLRFTTRTEKLTKCYEPLQKLRVRLWPYKIDLSPPVILYLLIVPRRYFCGGSFVLRLGVSKNKMCCWHNMYAFVYLVKFR